MRWFVVVTLAILVVPAWSLARGPGLEETPPARILPGDDLGISNHATWVPGAGLHLRGVAGGRLLVDEALVLVVDRDAVRLVMESERHAPPGQTLTLFVRQDGRDVGRLHVTDGADARLDLGAARAGDRFDIAAELTLAPDAAGGPTPVRFSLTERPPQAG